MGGDEGNGPFGPELERFLGRTAQVGWGRWLCGSFGPFHGFEVEIRTEHSISGRGLPNMELSPSFLPFATVALLGGNRENGRQLTLSAVQVFRRSDRGS